MAMRLGNIGSCLFASALMTAALTTGCTVHARYYDPYYHDYHPVSGEVVYYSQWERETRREHVDLDKRNDAEKKEYWDWRHKHEDQH